ncbi:hypothetical protein HYR99_22965 [Candidatus Poribacteria bacterium]|nr:hypothetical protein [Candidatus Poribacteria bacterium]
MRTNHKTCAATFAFCLVALLTFASELTWANRYYAPGLGRFISRDAVGYAEGMNLYEYVNSRPTNSTDPDGENAMQMPKNNQCD